MHSSLHRYFLRVLLLFAAHECIGGAGVHRHSPGLLAGLRGDCHPPTHAPRPAAPVSRALRSALSLNWRLLLLDFDAFASVAELVSRLPALLAL